MKKSFAVIILALITSGAVTSEVAANPDNTTINANTIRKIRKELVTLPFYGVFDNLAFRYEEGVVTLYGQVSRPTLKKAAARVVERVAGVDQVVNRIEVLPLSNFDDRIRVAVYRSIYRQPGLDRLSLQAVPPIHIIVKNGHVTLEGVAPNKGDATRAFIAANGVSGVFSVKNNLRIEKNR
ncbi:MAG TPA: BON domain-containing protein [Blastocatellia bacterium]|jgi:Predicted periplasmic or secreted lipoprotein